MSKIYVVKKNIICLLVVAVVMILPSIIINANAIPTKGTDSNNNTWIYNKKNKTLSFKGKKEVEEYANDGHTDPPNWFFWNDEVKHVVIKTGIKGLGGSDFVYFTNLQTVYLPDTVTRIGSLCFDDCMNLKSVKMSKNITKIGYGAFGGCERLKSIYLGKKLKTIDGEAFIFCESLEKVTIPNSVLHVKEGAFAGCIKLREVRFPKKIKVISEQVFQNCKKLAVINIPSTVTTIYSGAFEHTAIKEITIPGNVEYIKEGQWGEGIFAGCKNLKTITIKSRKIKSCFKDAFTGIGKEVVVKVPKSKLDVYTIMFRESGLNEKVQIIGM